MPLCALATACLAADKTEPADNKTAVRALVDRNQYPKNEISKTKL